MRRWSVHGGGKDWVRSQGHSFKNESRARKGLLARERVKIIDEIGG